MTTVSTSTTEAREDARQATGQFGTQPHAESGNVETPSPSIDIAAATDALMLDPGPGYFTDDNDRISPQIWKVHTALISPSDHSLPTLNIETTIDDEEGYIYGIQVGFIDDRNLVIARHHDMNLFDELEGTSGRERARRIVAGLVDGYDEVHDLVHPRP